MEGARSAELVHEGHESALGKYRHPISVALPTAYGQHTFGDVDVLDSQSESLTQPEPGAIEKGRDEARDPEHRAEHDGDFVAREHFGEPMRPLRAHDVVAHGEGESQDLVVEELQRGEGLVLRRGRDVTVHGEGGEEGADFPLAHLPRMPATMMHHKAPNPPDIRLFRRTAQMARSHAPSHRLE